MPPAKPYTIKQAAAVVGMSVQWLKPRLSSVPVLAAMAFRTSGRTGHWRLPRAAFDAWAERFKAGEAFERQLPRQPRQRRLRRLRHAGMSADTSGAQDFMAALRAA